MLFTLAKCHGYVDGMKRTALAAAVMFLEANGIEVHLDAVNRFLAKHGITRELVCSNPAASMRRMDCNTSQEYWSDPPVL
jgi:prophage maintenance system killer protein